MKIQEGQKVYRLKPYQDGFIFSQRRFPAMVSSWGTGKSFSLITRALRACKETNNNLGLIVRKEFTDLRDSTVKDFEKYTNMKLNGSRDVVFPNKSTIMFRHLEELSGNNLQNMNLGFFGIEQAEELDSDEVFSKLRGRLRRDTAECWGAIVANSNGHNWIYNNWKLKNLQEGDLYEANTFDNEDNLPKQFIEDLKRLQVEKPHIYNRFVLNSWDESDTTDVIIQPSWVQEATRRQLWIHHPIRRLVSIDVARLGDDKTVFYALENGKMLAKEEHEKKNLMEVVGLALMFSARHGEIKTFAVDEIGVGGGVVDRLKELGKKVIEVNSSKRSSDPEAFYNTRAEIYANGAKMFSEGSVQINSTDGQLIEQLSWAKYKEVKSNGKFLVEAKEDIKKRYGRSPDNADAFLDGLWALAWVQPELNPETMMIERNGWKNGSYVPARPQDDQKFVYR